MSTTWMCLLLAVVVDTKLSLRSLLLTPKRYFLLHAITGIVNLLPAGSDNLPCLHLAMSLRLDSDSPCAVSKATTEQELWMAMIKNVKCCEMGGLGYDEVGEADADA